jgi:hypothetical protein
MVPAPVRGLVQEGVKERRTDPDLADRRDPHALDRMPVEERQNCRLLWDAIEELRKRTGRANGL